MLYLEPEKYGFWQNGQKVDLFLINQNLERDVEHWNKILGYDTMKFDGRYGWLARFLQAFENANVISQGYENINQCYDKVVFGHELMMYSGGGYTTKEHVQFFTRKMKNFFLGGGLQRKGAAMLAEGRDPEEKPFYRGRAKGGDENDANTVYTFIEENADQARARRAREEERRGPLVEFSDPRDGFVVKLRKDEFLETVHAPTDESSGEGASAGTSSGAPPARIVDVNWRFKSEKKLFLVQDRIPGKSFHRFVENMNDVVRYIELALALPGREDEWVIERHDFAALDFVEQARLASKSRIMFGAHGDGLAWGLFMEPNSVVMEAVPIRRGGYQVCDEGRNKNRRGIFGGLLKFAKDVTHICWANPRGEKSAINITTDVYDWNWRMLNLDIDMMKLAHWLRVALWTVNVGLTDAEYAHVQNALVQFYQEKGEFPPAWGEMNEQLAAMNQQHG